MAVSRRANPHVGPRRRNCQRLDAIEHRGVGDFFARTVTIDEAAMLARSHDAGVLVADVTQLCGFGGENGLGIR
ncbi:MAG: hypothetical protein WAU82_19415 [Candidatus Binatus sp.]|uniref:hypothetical protein n=1 Tax=Candidatus Binatus sp. TaxID=2811406 RepID=UPI003BAF6457